MLFKDIYYLELWRPMVIAQLNHLCNLYRGHYEEHSCEIICRWKSQTVLLKASDEIVDYAQVFLRNHSPNDMSTFQCEGAFNTFNKRVAI